MNKLLAVAVVVLLATTQAGCVAMGVAGAVVGAAGDVAEGTVNVTKGVAGAIIPGDGKKDQE